MCVGGGWWEYLGGGNQPQILFLLCCLSRSCFLLQVLNYMVLVSDFRKKRQKEGRKKSFSFADANRDEGRKRGAHRDIGFILHLSIFLNKTIPVCRETADASTVQCSTVLTILLQREDAAAAQCRSAGLLTRCRAEARVVRKTLTLPKPQQDSGVGALFIQTCPKAPIFPGSGGRSNHKGNIPPAGHLSLLSQTLGSLSLNPGRPAASICCSTRIFLSLLPLASAVPEEPGVLSSPTR